MRRFAIAAVSVAVLVLTSPALGAGTLPGRYSTKISSPPQFKGTWVLNLAAGGTYTVADNGHVVARGRYTTAGAKITFGHETGPAACATLGKYTWRRSGRTLTFRRTSEATACSGRAGVLSHLFTRA